MIRYSLILLLLVLVVFSGGVEAKEYPDLGLQAKSAILMDSLSGQILYAHNEHESRAPASITKIMTLVVALEAVREGKVSLEDEVSASFEATSYGGTQIWLEPGETMSLYDLLMAVAVGSANDAAVAVAEHIAGAQENFVELMNIKARQIGMKNTQFRNVHGLDAQGHYSTAYDIALLSRYALLNLPELLDYTDNWEYRVRQGTEIETWLVNYNKLLRRYDGADGLKTGFTNSAGHSVSATAVRGDTRLIAVILGGINSENRFEEATKLLNYGFANFETVPIARKSDVFATISVSEGVRDSVEVVPLDDFGITLVKGKKEELTREVILPDRVKAPLVRGDIIGEISLKLDGEEVATVPLVAAEDVGRISFLGLLGKLLRSLWPF